jgi:hypothetical protein
MKPTKLLAVLCLYAIACTEPTITGTSDSRGLDPSFGITQTKDYCERDPNCHYADPDSTQNGIFLGLDINPEQCYTILGDTDRDGLKDYCEQVIALEFGPLLSTSPSDDGLTRETYWAARHWTYSDGREVVRILYMLGYHIDGGSPNPACDVIVTGTPLTPNDTCEMHFGDSEWIVLDLSYQAAYKHWYVIAAAMSAHWSTAPSGLDSSDWYAALTLEYPRKHLGYPRVYVSRDKHANYRTRVQCDQGALFFDTCDDNQDDVRISTFANRNVGSNAVRFIDRVTSQSPYVHTGYEFFWSDYYFCGWDGPSVNHNRANCSTSYVTVLRYFGF